MVAVSRGVQFLAILRRVLLQFFRRPQTFLLLFLPSAFVLITSAIVGLSTSQDAGRFDGDLSPVSKFTRCVTFDLFGEIDRRVAPPCASVYFAPDSGAEESIMRRLAAREGLVFGEDVVGFGTTVKAAEDMFSSGRQVDFIVDIDASRRRSRGEDLVVLIHYNATVNYYAAEPALDRAGRRLGTSGRALALKRALDEAAAEVLLGTEDAALGVSVGSFPDLEDSGSSAATAFVEANLPLWLLGCYAFLVVAASAIDSERRAHHLVKMRMMGLVESSFWLSWFVIFLALAAVAGFITAAIGAGTGLDFFAHASFVATAMIFTTVGIAMAAFGLLVGAVFTARGAITASYVLFFIAALSAHLAIGITCSLRPFPTEYGRCYAHAAYDPSTNSAASTILHLLPSFHLGKMIEDVANVAMSEFAGVDGPRDRDGFYGAEDLFRSANLTDASRPASQPTATYYEAPSAAANGAMLLGLALVYLALAWYFSQVIVGDAGAAKPMSFVCSSAFWGLSERRPAVQPGDTVAAVKDLSAREGSVDLHKLSKTYKEVTALKECTFRIEAGSIFALCAGSLVAPSQPPLRPLTAHPPTRRLGQNGAGKSTLLSMLTGRTEPTHGTAFVAGLDVRDSMAAIQLRLGVCMQDDVLHGDLTAAEHVQSVARFKRLPRGGDEDLVHTVLGDVGLLADAHRLVSTFSGGMKRRLSVALSLIGDPYLVTLDEPTTGMDPIRRREVWRIIQRYRPGRIILLTSHSMEEADVLGDHVGVLISGRLRALGTPLFLKERYGSGYNVSLSVVEGSEATVEEAVRSVVPSATAVRAGAGVMHVIVHRAAARRALAQLLRAMEGRRDVREVGVSHSTLEDVFMALASTDRTLNAAGDDGGGGDDGDALHRAFSQPVRLRFVSSGGEAKTAERVVEIETEPCAYDESANVTDGEKAPLMSRATEAARRMLTPRGPTSPSTTSPSPGPSLAPATVAEDAVAVNVGGPITTARGDVAADADLLAFLGDRADDAFKPSTAGQFKALVGKHARLHAVQRRAVCCQTCCAVVSVVLCLLVQLVFGFSTGTSGGLRCARDSPRGESLLRFADEFGMAVDKCTAENYGEALKASRPNGRTGEGAETLDDLLALFEEDDDELGTIYTSYSWASSRLGRLGAVWDNASLCMDLPADACQSAAKDALDAAEEVAYAEVLAADSNATAEDLDAAGDAAAREARKTPLHALAAAGGIGAEFVAQFSRVGIVGVTVSQLCDDPAPRPEVQYVHLASAVDGDSSVKLARGRSVVDGAVALDASHATAREVAVAARDAQRSHRSAAQRCSVGTCLDEFTQALYPLSGSKALDAAAAAKAFKATFPDAAIFMTDADSRNMSAAVEILIWTSASDRRHLHAAASLPKYNPSDRRRCREGEHGHVLSLSLDDVDQCSVDVDEDASSLSADEAPTCANFLTNEVDSHRSMRAPRPVAPALLRAATAQAAATNALWTAKRRRRCDADCGGAECGSDGCGGSCGSCGEGLACGASRTCIGAAQAAAELSALPRLAPCLPACTGEETCASKGTCEFDERPRVRTAWLPLPELRYVNTVGSFEASVQVLLLPTIMMILMPQMASRVAAEVETGLVDAAELNGVPRAVYLLAALTYDLLAGLVLALAVVLMGYGFGLATFLRTSLALWMTVAALWSFAQGATALFVASVFPRARSAAITTSLLILGATIASFALETSGVDDWPWWLHTLPPLAFVRATSLVLRRGGSVMRPAPSLELALVNLGVTAVFCLGAALAILGVGRRPAARVLTAAMRRRSGLATSADDGGGAQVVDKIAVAAERRAAEEGGHPVVARRLAKTYYSIAWDPFRAGARWPRMLPKVALSCALGLSAGRRGRCMPHGALPAALQGSLFRCA